MRQHSSLKLGPSWQLIAGVGLGLTLMALLPLLAASMTVDDYVIPNRVFLLDWLFRQTWAFLIFPVVVGLTFGLDYSAVIRNRYLFATRTRADLRRSLGSGLLRAMTVAGGTFVAASGVLSVAALVMPVDLRPDVDGNVYDPASVGTFSQLTEIHPSLYFAWWPLWFGINAAVYAVFAWAALVTIRNRLVALVGPWVVWFMLYFSMAVVGLETWSPNTIFPFNLTQLPMVVPLVPLGVTVLLAAAVAWWTLSRAESLWVTQ